MGFTLPVNAADSIRSTIERAGHQRLDPSTDEVELRLLTDQVGMQYLAPALFATLPSVCEKRYAVMVLSPDALADWSEDDSQLLLALADPVARVLDNVTSETHS